MEGWIKLHRSFLDHWLCDEYRPLTKREAWETMLFTVNYEDKKVLIHGQLLECKRGQSLLSLENWSKLFVWSIGTTRHFFELLKNDKMIITEGLKNTTRLTICNYDKYQDKQQADNKLTTSSQQAHNKLTTTTKEYKKEKNIRIKEKKIIPEFQELPKIDFIDLIIQEFVKVAKENNREYQIIAKGKERKMAGMLLNQYKKSCPNVKSEAVLNGMAKYFDLCFKISDPFLNQNMSITLIVNKFNEINNILKNGNKRTKTGGVTDAELAGIFAKHFATDYHE